MSKKLANKIAVVTGGSAGIGLGAAKRLAEEGAQVCITGRRQSELDKAAAEIDGNVTAIHGDASKLADLDRIYAMVKERAGRIEVLFANAGTYEFGTLGKITEEHFDKIFDTNVRGLLFTVQKARRFCPMAPAILTGSIASSFGIPSMSVHSASKAGLALLRAQLDPRSQGARHSRQCAEPRPHRDLGPPTCCSTRSEQAGLAPTIRCSVWALRTILGKAAVFLASEDSAYITGAELVVDGGVTQS